ncbi:long-chain-fatty-acid--CoA ligase [Amorphus sp. 3PC139-8]|uniref:long-chain-fatty-acid--CoA ligase n=1 Tax=Amorphus sp. 3PC139-8 TaxID=2735676 RepID=UPI00345D0B8B
MAGSLREFLEFNAASTPDKVIVTAGAEEMTWSELKEAACRVASALVRDGVAPQERVIYIGKNSPRFFEVMFGCALAGAVIVPVNWRLAPGELAAIVANAEAKIAFLDTSVVTSLDVGPGRVVALGDHETWAPYADWIGPAEDPAIPVAADHIAFQLYTSGTTGRPKGAMFENATNLRVLLERISVEWGFTENDVSLVALPLFHMGGLAWALAGMARGARAVVVRDFDPAQVVDMIEREGVTIAFFVPAMLSAICAVPGIGDRRLALRRVFYSGAPISPTALLSAMAALHCDFVQIYGLTEATGAFAQLQPHEHDPEGPLAHLLLSAGRAYPWVEVRVVSMTDERDMPVGEIGEIWTRSEQNLVGYWNDPERTSQVLTADGWLKTGDLGRVDENGHIFLVDRAKDLVISGGENVYPVEVENVLAAHPQLAEVAVIGVPHDRWGETVMAIVVPRAGETVDGEDVIAFVRQRLAKFKCPTVVDVVTALPRTATGKVLKHVLREPYWRGYDRRIN